MPEMTQPSRFRPPPTRRKIPPLKPIRWTTENLQAERGRLFETGSHFLPTQRDEIVGIDNVLLEVDEVIHAILHHKDYRDLGARLEPGVIFEGDPGTGKTLVSRYIATASNALFVNVRDYPHLEALYQDADIRDLFARAREFYASTGDPVVLFWDEFEGVALDRQNGTPEQIATVSQLTAELDGIHGKNEGLLLIGCTNYIFDIDPALKRSGRMGLKIEFCAPDREGKGSLLSHYLSSHDISDIDVDTLSWFFEVKATAADIEEASVEAWRYAVRRALKDGGPAVLTQEDLVQVFLKRLVGPPTPFVNLPEEDRMRVAIHECGHALTALAFDIPLRLITVQPGKKSLGRCITAEMREHIGTIDEMHSQMRVAVGSLAAETVARIPACTGSRQDLAVVNEIAVSLVDMFDTAHRTKLFNIQSAADTRAGNMDTARPNVSQDAVAASDRDVQDLLAQTKKEVSNLMNRIGQHNLWKIAEGVNEAVTLTGAQFEELVTNILGQRPMRPIG